MRPYYESGGITIYHGDSLEILPTLPAVDAMVTDPPYGVRSEEWDAMSEQEFSRFTMDWLASAKKLAPVSMIFCNQWNLHVVKGFSETLYDSVRLLIWHKPKGSQYNGAHHMKTWYSFEPILFCHPKEKTVCIVGPKANEVGQRIKAGREAAGLSRGGVEIKLRGKKTGLCYRWEEGACLPTQEQLSGLKSIIDLGADFDAIYEHAAHEREANTAEARQHASERSAKWFDVLSYRTVTKGNHPCEKPLALISDLIGMSSEPGQLILDPFIGSGTAMLAARDLGRRAIGIEKDEKYCEMAAKRLSENNGQLFRSA